jgi:hypothetical protein
MIGEKHFRYEFLMFAWIENQQKYYLCVCDCGALRILRGASVKNGNQKSCGCLRREKAKESIIARNAAQAGQPRSAKGKLASQAACKKMNEVRHNQAKHILSNVDSAALTGDCNVCGRVPVKVMKHRNNKWQYIRDQYLCWVGTRNRVEQGEPAKVSYPNQALEMWDKQENNCALCGGPMVRAGNSWDGATLDHCHSNGFIRGFIHQGCNKGLGHFLDDPEALRKAAAYIERARGLLTNS